MSVKFVSAILGLETAARILWTPGKMCSFCRKTYVHKIPRLGGGGDFGFGGGGSADFIFMGARIFLIYEIASDHFNMGNGKQRHRICYAIVVVSW